MASQLTHEDGGRAVPVRVVRSAQRTKTMSLAVVAGEVVVRAPVRVTNDQVREFVEQRRAWIAARLASATIEPRPRPMVEGARLPYLGREIALRTQIGGGGRQGASLAGGALIVRCLTPFDETRIRSFVARWYRQEAQRVFAAEVSRWARTAELTPAAVIVRDQRRRWGSCGPDGTIRLNWRLLMAPLEVIEYVVVHELAHLRHKHHQPPFWAEVERMLPDFRERRRRLTEVGPRLTL